MSSVLNGLSGFASAVSVGRLRAEKLPIEGVWKVFVGEVETLMELDMDLSVLRIGIS